jgi:O-antigen/teichoic acid export membrane protein
MGTTSVPKESVVSNPPQSMNKVDARASDNGFPTLIGKVQSTFSFKFDVLANIAGVSWTAVVQLACIPFYIRFMGIEAYGLIGFYLVLVAMLQVLDLGLSPTINREMARYSVQPEKAVEARDLVRTLETGYWLIGLAIGCVMVASAPVIASHWIKTSALGIQNVRRAVMIMGVLAFLQWPISFYQGGLMGLGRQVLYNSLKILQSTVANGGAVLVLWLVSPTIQAFFRWQVVASAAYVAFLVILLWRSLPSTGRLPRFDLALARGIWGFAAGMSGIAVFALILTQADKLILSKMVNLRVFGYYTLAGMFGTGLLMIVGSVFNAIYPRLSALVAVGDENGVRHLYHRSTQIMAVLILPVAVVLVFYSNQILQLWTRNSDIAVHAGPIAALLVIGSALNGLMTLPYALQLAYGWTSIALRITILLAIVVVPAIWFMARHYGPVGAACVWPALNIVNALVALPLTHRRLLKREAWRWVCEIVLPLTAVLLIVLVCRQFVTASMTSTQATGAILFQFVCGTGAAALVSPSIRSWLLNRLLKMKAAY